MSTTETKSEFSDSFVVYDSTKSYPEFFATGTSMPALALSCHTSSGDQIEFRCNKEYREHWGDEDKADKTVLFRVSGRVAYPPNESAKYFYVAIEQSADMCGWFENLMEWMTKSPKWRPYMKHKYRGKTRLRRVLDARSSAFKRCLRVTVSKEKLADVSRGDVLTGLLRLQGYRRDNGERTLGIYLWRPKIVTCDEDEVVSDDDLDVSGE